MLKRLLCIPVCFKTHEPCTFVLKKQKQKAWPIALCTIPSIIYCAFCPHLSFWRSSHASTNPYITISIECTAQFESSRRLLWSFLHILYHHKEWLCIIKMNSFERWTNRYTCMYVQLQFATIYSLFRSEQLHTIIDQKQFVGILVVVWLVRSFVRSFVVLELDELFANSHQNYRMYYINRFMILVDECVCTVHCVLRESRLDWFDV